MRLNSNLQLYFYFNNREYTRLTDLRIGKWFADFGSKDQMKVEGVGLKLTRAAL